ncbi:MAG: FAD-binding oxidoreductase, partial [Paracoccaceae bacterium]|nr:FAD-binding oxidoreductase [Paracoccaceae bacterium]
MADVTIIGAGVAGLWAAYALSQRGITPRLIDRNGIPGAHGCSWWAGGMLAPFCEGATSEPAVIAHGQQAAADWAGVTKVTQNGSLVVTLARDRAELDRFARRTTGHDRISGACAVPFEGSTQAVSEVRITLTDGSTEVTKTANCTDEEILVDGVPQGN